MSRHQTRRPGCQQLMWPPANAWQRGPTRRSWRGVGGAQGNILLPCDKTIRVLSPRKCSQEMQKWRHKDMSKMLAGNAEKETQGQTGSKMRAPTKALIQVSDQDYPSSCTGVWPKVRTCTKLSQSQSRLGQKNQKALFLYLESSLMVCFFEQDTN